MCRNEDTSLRFPSLVKPLTRLRGNARAQFKSNSASNGNQLEKFLRARACEFHSSILEYNINHVTRGERTKIWEQQGMLVNMPEAHDENLRFRRFSDLAHLGSATSMGSVLMGDFAILNALWRMSFSVNNQLF